MRRAAIILCAALVLGLPTISSAQYNDNDQQNPKEYHDEDSQFLAVVSDVFYPIGYAFEWLIARPLHYVATESPAAPVFKPMDADDGTPPPPAPIIPDNTLNSAAAESNTPQDWSPTRAGVGRREARISGAIVGTATVGQSAGASLNKGVTLDLVVQSGLRCRPDRAHSVFLTAPRETSASGISAAAFGVYTTLECRTLLSNRIFANRIRPIR